MASDQAQMQQREALARELAGGPATDRVLNAAASQWLPRGGSRGAQQVAAELPIAGARFTFGTLMLALREAPLVLVVLIAVFLASETWQFFARLDGWEYGKVLAGLLVVMVVILVAGLREEARAASTIPGRSDSDQPPEAPDLEQPLASAGFGEPPEGLRAPWTSRALLRGTQVAQLVLLCLGVGLVAAGAFTLMGATAVSPELAGSWATRAGEEANYRTHELLDISLLGKHAETVTRELLLVSGAIGAIAALAFSVELVTGERLRGEVLRKRFDGYRTAFRAWARLYHGEAPPRPAGETEAGAEPPDAGRGPAGPGAPGG